MNKQPSEEAMRAAGEVLSRVGYSRSCFPKGCNTCGEVYSADCLQMTVVRALDAFAQERERVLWEKVSASCKYFGPWETSECGCSGVSHCQFEYCPLRK